MSKPPLAFVSRCRPSPPSPPRRARVSASASMSSAAAISTTAGAIPKPKPPNTSRLLAALDALSLSDVVEPPNARAPAKKKSSLQRVSQAKAKPAAAAPIATEPDAEPATPAAELPIYSYKDFTPAPRMHFTRDAADADAWVAKLDLSGPLSVDFEWVVAFRKTVQARPISLVQIADAHTIVVVQLRTSAPTSTPAAMMGGSPSMMARFPPGLQRVLEDPKVMKAGANILGDAKKLFKDYGVMMRGLVELGALARVADPQGKDAAVWGKGRKIVALAKLVERYLQKRLRKDDDVRISNWEDPRLEQNTRQIEYAANDAYCGMQVYAHLLALASANSITVDASSTTTSLHYAHLASPTVTHTPKPRNAIPNMVLTPDMAAAGVTGQALRAYRHWALAHWEVDAMCRELAVQSGAVLTRGTVVSYVVTAIQCWPELEYDLGRLRELLQTDLRSWERHYKWVVDVAGVAP
ncbi:Nuclear transport factor 2 [Mycena sanguinolenta]|uniref:Nuclear transport factor 2 n=1 Tax=Mycena sanguinolenta TaxID=230812 RepID=A0A8H6ZCG7_9AGAR|nr:Nuclear transport factor 2 [Mycena sanguinolenta]